MGIRIDQHEAVTFGVGGADVTLAAKEVTRLWLQKMLRETEPQFFASPMISPYGVPYIGKPWKDGNGIYAGMARGAEGARDYALLVGDHVQKSIKWKPALDWAKKVGDSWRVMTPAEAWLCQANVPELFEKTWHWTCAEYPGGDACAYAQHFGGGNQGGFHEDYECSVRLVRSVFID